MSEFEAFQRAIHTPAFWQADDADRNAMFAPYTTVQEADVTPVNAYQLGLLALQEMVRMGQIVKALALETPPPEPPKRRGRLPKVHDPAEKLPSRNGRKERVLSVSANPELAMVEVMGMKLSPEQARDLADRLHLAADALEGVPEGEP